MKKKLVCLLMVLSLAGCNSNRPTDNSQKPSEDDTNVSVESPSEDTQSSDDESSSEDDSSFNSEESIEPEESEYSSDSEYFSETEETEDSVKPDESENTSESDYFSETEDPNQPLDISIRNLYFADYSGGDIYLEELEEKFNVSLKLQSYSWSTWNEEVTVQVNGGNTGDVFHANISSSNYGNTYKKWVEDEILKPLPDDLSNWPNIENLIQNTSNIDHLKIDGKLYGIPIHQDDIPFANYTYMYRRDWAKQWGVYQENDEYTWEQFMQLLLTFKERLERYCYPLADSEWGYPSITNFYKKAPYCYVQDNEGQYVNNFTTNEYIEGLQMSKMFTENGLYHPDQFNFTDGYAQQCYIANRVGVFYENLSYSNFVNIRRQLERNNKASSNFNLDDASAIMKIKSPADKYVLEGTENWFSMTLFNYSMTDRKQEKMLDILDWLLSEEGTRNAIYGMEGYDFNVVDGEVELIDEQWQKDSDGNYAPKTNGVKYLRYMVSLGYDTLEYDPYTNLNAYNIVKTWQNEMNQALEDSSLYIINENPEVAYLATPQKSNYTEALLSDARVTAMKYVYNKITTIEDYIAAFNDLRWDAVLSEINEALGK